MLTLPLPLKWDVERFFPRLSLIGGPAKLGTKWEQNANRFGKRLFLLNTCNIYETNRKFGWKTEKPFLAQVTFLLEADKGVTKLTWSIESDEGGIVQLTEPLLIKQTDLIIRNSFARLKKYLQSRT